VAAISAHLCSSALSALDALPCALRSLCALFVREAVHDPLDPGLHRGCAKVEQQTDGILAKSKVGLNLPEMNRRQRFLCFDLDENTALDDEIGAEPTVDSYSPVDERHGSLALDSEFGLGKLVLETREIGTLEQAGTESSVDSYSGVEHAGSQAIQRFGCRRRGHAADVAAGVPEGAL